MPSATAPTEAALRDKLAHRERQIEAIRAISEAIFSHTSIDELLRETLEVAMETIGAGAGSVQIHDPQRDVLVFRYVAGPASEQLQDLAVLTSQGIAGRVFRSGTPDVTSEAGENPDFNREIDSRTGLTTHAMATVPIKRRGGAAIGVMQVLNFERHYDVYDVEILEVIAGQVASAIESARLEQQGRKAAMVNFIGDLSHDIKNMLTPIQTGVWTLDPMLREMFDHIERATLKLPREARADLDAATDLTRESYEWILQNALDAAERVQNRTKEIADAVKGISTPPRFERDDFNAACQEVISALRLVAHDAQVELVSDLDPTLPPIEFDHKQIYNALYNLVNNAIPETPEGGQITLRTRALKRDNAEFLVEIADTGKGMPREIREKLFTDEAVSTKPGGTGLGTRIVGDIVKRHHGTIGVESEVGKGTTFTLLLPLKQN